LLGQRVLLAGGLPETKARMNQVKPTGFTFAEFYLRAEVLSCAGFSILL
jgi:hypothetical protein